MFDCDDASECSSASASSVRTERGDAGEPTAAVDPAFWRAADTPRAAVLARLRAAAAEVATALTSTAGPVEVALVARGKSGLVVDAAQLKVAAAQLRRRTLVLGPASRVRGFAVYLRVLEIVHGLVRDGACATKRDIFYQDVNLFKTQAAVDHAVEDIACTLRVTRANLHVLGGKKGMLFSKSLSLEVVDGGDSTTLLPSVCEGTLIPPVKRIRAVSLLNPAATKLVVLVVEKECTFQHLAPRLLDTSTSPAITRLNTLIGSHPWCLVTGKGYPDLNTREFLALLAQSHPVSVHGLFDADPFGLDIFLTYRIGAAASAYAGLAPIEMRLFRVSDFGGGEPQHSMIPMTQHDRKKAVEILRRLRGYCSDAGDALKSELREYMRLMSKGLRAGYKLELQSVFC